MRPVRQIILHYTETQEDIDFDVSDVKEWHLDRGFSDIGYHFLIKLDGEIQKGRDLDKIGAHCKTQNSDSIGICYVGGKCADGTLGDTRTKEQIEAIDLLIQSLRVIFPKENLIVFGHNDYSTKVCPGYDAKIEHN